MALSQLQALANPLDNQQLQRLQSALEGMSTVQLAWVGGYLAGLGSQPPQPLTETVARQPITILVGSESGNGRTIAGVLVERAASRGFEVRLVSMDDYQIRDLVKERVVLIVVSTHGEGDPPETARDLHSYLHSKRAPKLDKLKYAVLGLGDSSYQHFCQTAKDFDERLHQLGGERLLARVECDVEYQQPSDEWAEKTLSLLKAHIPAQTPKQAPKVVPLTTVATEKSQAQYGRDNPYRARLLENRRITGRGAVGDVRHLILSIDPEAIRYTPGDALGIWFRNDPMLVDEILSEAGLQGDARITYKVKESSLSDALLSHYELTRLHPALIRGWAALAQNDELSAIAADQVRLWDYIQQHQVIDLVSHYPAHPSAADFAGLLRPLQPRLYSISSSQAEFADEIHLTLCLLQYQACGRDYQGGASGFLAERLREDETLDVYLVENPCFRLPGNGETPIIMIGAGTGVAPYRAFMQQRAINGDQGANWLIFGNRYFHNDFLYQTEWQKHRKAGLLDRIDLAFSRDRRDKVYVQHQLRQNGSELYRWLEEGAHLYLCGASAMGAEVNQALIDVVSEHSGQSPAGAEEYLEALRRQGRFQQDLY